MEIIDVLGKPCPIPVNEAKRALAEHKVDNVTVKVDNFVAVQNLEKMANGFGYGFSYTKDSIDRFDAVIRKGAKNRPEVHPELVGEESAFGDESIEGVTVAIGRCTMGDGSEELGRALIKGFICSLSELPTAPHSVVFFNSGAYLTSVSSHAVDDLKRLEAKGTKILTCGTCANYYKLPSPAVGEITDMYGITEKLTSAAKVVSV